MYRPIYCFCYYLNPIATAVPRDIFPPVEKLLDPIDSPLQSYWIQWFPLMSPYPSAEVPGGRVLPAPLKQDRPQRPRGGGGRPHCWCRAAALGRGRGKGVSAEKSRINQV